ncbi:hypothetical protein HY502_02970 [Candidatus Woesebacteria bacterium]|nr:hypothetical protein [Candidatus Woesebacteria bacterium]
MDPEKEVKGVLEKVFRPGNLVWGTRISQQNDRWSKIVDGGIKRSKETGVSTWHFTPHCISMAVMPNSKPPRNYLYAEHSGPRLIAEKDTEDLPVAIIIDKGSLNKSYSGQLLAVGPNFKSEYRKKYPRLNSSYDFNDKEYQVFGIPIYPSTYEIEPWGDEVRLYENVYPEGKKGKTPTVRFHHWLGIVIHADDLEEFKEINEKIGRKLNLPLFSSEAKLLDFI